MGTNYIKQLEEENERLRSAHIPLVAKVNSLEKTCKELQVMVSLYDKGTTEFDASIISKHVEPPSHDSSPTYKEVVICPICFVASRWVDNLDIDTACKYCGKETHLTYSNVKKYMAIWKRKDQTVFVLKRHWIFWRKTVVTKEPQYRWVFSWET